MIAQDYLPRAMYKDKTFFVGGGSGFGVDGGSNLIGSAPWNQFVEAMDVRRK